jgi:hypothetical protein
MKANRQEPSPQLRLPECAGSARALRPHVIHDDLPATSCPVKVANCLKHPQSAPHERTSGLTPKGCFLNWNGH